MRLRNNGDVDYVAGRNRILQLTPVLDTGAIYSFNDVLFETVEIKAVDPHNGPDSNGNGTLPAFTQPAGTLVIESISFVDAGKSVGQTQLLFFKSDVSIGTVNGAEALSAANATELVGEYFWQGTGWGIPLQTGQNINVQRNVGIMLFGDTDSTSLFVGGVNLRTSVTKTADTTSDITLIISCFAY